MTIAFDRHNDGLIDFATLDEFFSALEEPFDFKAHVNLRCGWWSKMCELQQRHLGLEHLAVAGSLNNLALLYHNQGQYAQAEPLYKQALAIRERATGPEHPAVVTYLENYVLCLRAMDCPDEAALLLNLARRQFGPNTSD